MQLCIACIIGMLIMALTETEIKDFEKAVHHDGI